MFPFLVTASFLLGSITLSKIFGGAFGNDDFGTNVCLELTNGPSIACACFDFIQPHKKKLGGVRSGDLDGYAMSALFVTKHLMAFPLMRKLQYMLKRFISFFKMRHKVITEILDTHSQTVYVGSFKRFDC